MSAPSPYDDPVPNGWRLVCATLRISAALMCWGLATDRLYSESEDSAAQLLVFLGWLPTDHAPQVSKWAAWSLVLCGFLTLFRPCWPVLLPVAAWSAARAAGPAVLDDDPLASWDQTVLVAAPLVLMLIEFWPPWLKFSLGRTRFALGLLRLAITVSLAAQAALFIREIGAAGEFSRSLGVVCERVSFPEFKEPLASRVLAVLAAVNVALGLVILSARQRSVLFGTTLWCCALAMIPVVVDGLSGTPALLIDIPRSGAALALYWFWLMAIKEQSPTIVPA